MTLNLDLHGVPVQVTDVSGRAGNVLAQLRHDFGHFEKNPPDRFLLQIQLSSPQAPAMVFPIFRTRMCRVFKTFGGRAFDYGDGTTAQTKWINGVRVFTVSSANEDELYEVAYVILLSAAGELLDKRGFHRVHALGLTFNGESCLVILPQGGGKSALAMLLDADPRIKFHSDEIPLVKDGLAYPFPLRKALRPEVAEALGCSLHEGRRFKRKLFPHKWLYPFSKDKVAGTAAIRAILIGRRSASGEALIRPTGSWPLFKALAESMIVGLGVPQMAEYMLRLSPGLLVISLSRLREALRMCRRSRAYVFEVSEDARVNAKVLLHFLDGRR